MELYFMNFKQVLVVLTSKYMREDILDTAAVNELDVNFKFVDSYLEAAKLINAQTHDPYDYIILNTSINNKKSKDFMEFIASQIEKNPSFVIEYTKEGDLLANQSTIQE